MLFLHDDKSRKITSTQGCFPPSAGAAGGMGVYSGNNCANFVSQCFLEGGNAIMNTSGTWVWWYDNKGTTNPSDDTHSNSWSLAADQAYHLVRITDVSKHRGQYVSNASDLIIGDSIYYDWTNNGVINHTVIVVAVRNGVPFIAGNTADEFDVPWNKNAGRTRFLKVTDFYWIN